MLFDSAESLITISNLDADVYERLAAQTDAELAVLDIQRLYLSKQNNVKHGELIVIVDPSGSGKSTLLTICRNTSLPQVWMGRVDGRWRR